MVLSQEFVAEKFHKCSMDEHKLSSNHPRHLSLTNICMTIETHIRPCYKMENLHHEDVHFENAKPTFSYSQSSLA